MIVQEFMSNSSFDFIIMTSCLISLEIMGFMNKLITSFKATASLMIMSSKSDHDDLCVPRALIGG